MNSNAIKRQLASAFEVTAINSAGIWLQKSLFSPFIRVINYHGIPNEYKESFESHLAYYSANFINVEKKDLHEFLNGKTWQHDKPGLIISFDDGLTSHIETAAPLLEKYGFTGWFFIPAERVEESICRENALTPDQVKRLDVKHVIGCHTATHLRLGANVTPNVLELETLGAKKLLEDALGHPVEIFCWVGGEEFAYSREAAQIIKLGYELSFMTNNAVVRPDTNPLQLQRTNIEAENPLSLVKFQLAGFMDIAYTAKRRRVNRLTK